MKTSKRLKQIHVRLDERALAAVEALRRQMSPIPSVAEVLRQAAIEKFERDIGLSSSKNERR